MAVFSSPPSASINTYGFSLKLPSGFPLGLISFMLAPMMTLGVGTGAAPAATSERAFLGADWPAEGDASREGEATRFEPAREAVAVVVDLKRKINEHR